MHALLLAVSVLTYDVLISAGHEGRPANCKHFPTHHCNLGAAGERQWTPIVADAAARALRAKGYTVARLPADFAGHYRVKAAVFIHFDGSNPPCHSTASVGYPPTQGPALAQAWRKFYGRYWPFGFEPDNFTAGLREYYAYRQVNASVGSLVLELGDVTCPAQKRWLASRLTSGGKFISILLNDWLRVIR